MSGPEALRELLAPAGTPRRIVAVPDASHEEILGCIGRAIGRIAEFVLIGNVPEIRLAAARAGIDLSGARFLAEEGETASCALAARLVRDGDAHLLMKGQVQTATLIRAILDRENGLTEPGRLVSHVTVCGIPRYHKPLLVTDAAITVEPGLEQKAEILRNALWVARELGIRRPRVACVAPVEKENPKIRSTVDAAALARLASDPLRGFGELDILGPVGLDIAVSAEAARTKGVSSPVAGEADILLLPGLDAANVLYKSLTAFSGALMARWSPAPGFRWCSPPGRTRRKPSTCPCSWRSAWPGPGPETETASRFREAVFTPGDSATPSRPGSGTPCPRSS